MNPLYYMISIVFLLVSSVVAHASDIGFFLRNTSDRPITLTVDNVVKYKQNATPIGETYYSPPYTATYIHFYVVPDHSYSIYNLVKFSVNNTDSCEIAAFSVDGSHNEMDLKVFHCTGALKHLNGFRDGAYGDTDAKFELKLY